MITRCLLGFALLCALPLQEGWAWGPAGHRIVGHIAEMNLNPEVRQAIQQKFNIKHLANVANWADEIKKRPDKPDVLHFTNIAPGQRIYRQSRDCPRKRCVTEKIKAYQRVLLDESAFLKTRKEAFKFLVHLVADVHQPMHMGHARDRGGNEITVGFQGEPVNLHRVWDSRLIFLKGRSEIRFARFLNRGISPQDRQGWLGGIPDDWTNESRGLVLDYGYTLQFSKGRELSPRYIARGRVVIERQLQRAGIRLADMLNRLMKP